MDALTAGGSGEIGSVTGINAGPSVGVGLGNDMMSVGAGSRGSGVSPLSEAGGTLRGSGMRRQDSMGGGSAISGGHGNSGGWHGGGGAGAGADGGGGSESKDGGVEVRNAVLVSVD